VKTGIFRCLVILIVAMLLSHPTQAATTILRVVSPQIPISTGENFTVDILVSNASNLGSFQFVFTYNPTIVKFEKIILGDFLGSTGRAANPLGPRVDEASGRVTFGAFTLGQQPGANGSGTLATVTLRALGGGTSSLELREPQITDISGVVQPVSAESGQVTIPGRPAAPQPLSGAALALTQPSTAGPVTGGAIPVSRAAEQGDQSGLTLFLVIGAVLALAVMALVLLARRR